MTRAQGRVARFLKKHNMKYRDFAEKAGVTLGTVGQIVAGHRNITYKQAPGIAKAMGCKWTTLLLDNEKPDVRARTTEVEK